jgi:hypothetical protein
VIAVDPRTARPSFIVAAVALAGLVGAAAFVQVRGLVVKASAGPAVVGRAVPAPPRLDALTPARTVPEIMATVVDPASDALWESVGSVATASTDEAWTPASDTDWARLAGHAHALAAAADALATPVRVNGRDAWAVQARALRAASDVALEAVRRRDAPALFTAGEGIVNACDQCHERYWIVPSTAAAAARLVPPRGTAR